MNVQHETIGVFRVVQKLQELFRAGAVRLDGAALSQWDPDRLGRLDLSSLDN